MFFVLNILLPNGYYNLNLNNNEKLLLYFDFSISNSIWVRLNYKIGNSFFSTLNQSFLNNNQVLSIYSLIKDFGWSDCIYTINSTKSWIMENVNFSKANTNLDLISLLTNIFNGKTPTGENWNLEYSTGYIFYEGTFKSFQNWDKIFYGCSSFLPINSKSSFRSGGGVSHTGEYIHGNCNDYQTINNSITSRVNWDNSRVFWAKLNLTINNLEIPIFSNLKHKKTQINFLLFLLFILNQ